MTDRSGALPERRTDEQTVGVAEPSTARGRETRERILLAAARLFHERSVNATSVDDVLTAAAAGKGQFYRYFPSKDELVAAVVRHQLEDYLARQRETLEQLDDWESLEGYLMGLAAAHRERDFVGGCPVGSLAIELADQDEGLRRRLAEGLDQWQASLAAGLRRLAERGRLREGAPADRLAATTLATVQGAYLLSTVRRDGEVMARVLREAVTHLRTYATDPDGDRETGGTV